MLSIAKSRYTLTVQLVFIAVNAVGISIATVYNALTPDLYPNNAHHKIGWIITWITAAHTLVQLAGRLTDTWNNKTSRTGYQILHSLPPERDSTPCAQDSYCCQEGRASNDSGQGTASQSSSVRSDSASTICADDGGRIRSENSKKHGNDNDDDEFRTLPLSSPTPVARITRILSHSVWKYVEMGYKLVDRVILPFGFIALTTGIVAFARFFEGHAIFGGLAHWIKGGVFFWLGLFNLGRWSGSFAELGWAWNLRPKASSQQEQKFRPSAEFVESSLILFYGSTNIFLEHLGGWGGEWTAQDLEHMAITVLFIGGGLCGMLVESSHIRDLLNTTTTAVPIHSYSNEEQERLEAPETYELSLNPIPALVILLLGIMMSSHHQATTTASMVHKQWGTLLLWASVARGLSYVLLYLKPPKSIFPSRPPTELLTSFGLIAGGIIFMASSADTVNGMIHYDLDAMFFYTITMGLVGLLMAWEITVLSIKGWAVRKELALSGWPL
ncbi:putative domain YCR061W, C-terminal [Akanthomyces lecanii RCEF 1005]|uniref:Putative domain YCR061W, C-terminal n=1 Tax=Akanthomyces lecanii RCEF 1005 TaxID=1081108 RepID=A0A168KMV6_CORDF|nr:putative domain YCR061W, C-terminal [Akanthomyces lecanii RCEF 1005]